MQRKPKQLRKQQLRKPPQLRKQQTRKQQNKSITTLCDVKKGQENLSLLFLPGYGLFFPFLLYSFIMFKKIIAKIIAYNNNLTVKVRLVVLTVAGLAITM